MILFFETYSIIQTLILFRFVKRANVIFFHKRSFFPLKYNSRIKITVERLIRLLNRQVKIETLPADRINDHNWVMNKRSVKFVEGLTGDIKNSSIYNTILKIINDENILKCYKVKMIDDISARLLFFRIAKELIENRKDSTYLVPAENDNSKIQKELFGNEILNPYILQGSVVANQTRNFLNKIYALILFFFLPSAYIILNLKKIKLRRIDKKKYDIAMPIMSGFYEGDVIFKGVKREQDDSYLYNKKITMGRIIHVFNYWRFTPEIEESYKNVMDKRCIPYIDTKDYKINVNLLTIAAKIQLKIIRHFLLRLFFWHDRYQYISYSNRIIYWMLRKYLEFENVDYKVELIRHDYSPNHIVDTIICNQYNKKTAGIQHSASPYDLPQLCYVHLDKYIVYGDIFIKLFKPYWEKIKLSKTGRENIDWVVNILKDGPKIATLRKKLFRKYKHRRYTAAIAFPGGSEYNLKSRWDEIYDALCDLKNLEVDFNLFLRFRKIDDLYNYEHIKRFENLPKEDERIVINHVDFTTYELMSLSDLFIANSSSFAVYEALAAGVKVFTFDYMGTAKYLFPDCGKDFIIYNKKDVLKVFKGLNDNFNGFDCNWEKLKKEGSFYYDGRNLERIQQTVFETVKEVDGKKFQ